MSDRAAFLTDFITRAGWGDAERAALAGDASSRCYWRLKHGAGRAVLMDCPPNAEAPICPPDADAATRLKLGWNATARLAAGRVEAFVCVTGWLRQQGLSAPEIYAADAVHGFALVEDLGDDLYARAITTGADEATLYDAAWDALMVVQSAQPPHHLQAHGLNWTVLDYDAIALKAGADLYTDWLPKLDTAFDLSPARKQDWDVLWAHHLPRLVPANPVLILRDYHAENLLWLPQRSAVKRVGLIDVQDAVRGHPAWDVLMLTQDARRDVSPAVAADLWARFEDRYGAEARGQAAILGVLNAARILGVFARLAVRDGKPKYLDFMPRVWRALDENLSHPAARDFADWFAAHRVAA